MAEENNGQLESRTTEELSFEAYVKQTLAALTAEQKSMRQKMVERFLQLSRQLREVDAKVSKVEGDVEIIKEDGKKVREDIKDLDYKVDAFIREHIRIKRGLREVQELLGLES